MMVTIQDLTKTYNKGALTAVRDVSFNVDQGELFGLIGPDGAGKTTLLRMLTTLLLPDSGSARINDLDMVQDYREIRKQVGYMQGRFSLYPDLTVAENIQFFATIFQTSIKENYALIRDIYEQIAPFQNRRAGKLSGGMKQKLALCCALIHRPTVLFLDEPTTGVDVVSRKEFWEMLQKLKQQGISILVSTPYMDEATQCDRIALMQQGALLSVDTPERIVQQFPKRLYGARAPEIYQLLRKLEADDAVESCYPFGEYLHFTLWEATADSLSHLATRHTPDGLEIRTITPTIEDCFIRLMHDNLPKTETHAHSNH